MDGPSLSSAPGEGGGDGLKDYACLPCRQRKVKCDRHVPCNHCCKSDNPQQCSFVPPTRGLWKRKQTKPPKESLHAKLKRYEDLLKSLGANLDGESKEEASPVFDGDASTPASHADSETFVSTAPIALPGQRSSSLGRDPPHFVGKNGTSKYFDSALWTRLGHMHPEIEDHDESPSDGDDTDGEGESALFLEMTPSKKVNLSDYWPNSLLLSRLKSIFLDRVDPLLKIFHGPTFWESITTALQDPRKMSKGLEAAMLAWCFSTVTSVEDGECFGLLGAEKRQLTSHFKLATRCALAKAGFLRTSDLNTLRGYLCYLVGMRSEGLCDSLFVLSGMTIRLAQTMGLHRDGKALGLSPFDTEIRRRLWWHIVHLDFRAADMHGAMPSLDLSVGDAKYPLNLEDEDLHPEMTEFPAERTGLTSITGCILRCEMIDALRRFSNNPTRVRWDSISDLEIPLARKEAIINEIENHLETKYLQYCDPLTPYHQLIAVMVRLPVCWMRFFAHNPRPFGNSATALPQKSRDIAFKQAIKMLEYAGWMHGTTNGLGKFMWQSGASVLWRSILYVLIEIRERGTGPDVEHAWQGITDVLSKRPEMFEVSTSAVFRALCVWTLEVWDECSAALDDGECIINPGTLVFIAKLRQTRTLRKQAEQRKTAPKQASQIPVPDQLGLETEALGTGLLDFDPSGLDFPPFDLIASDPNGWSTWEDFMIQDGNPV